MDGIRTNLPPFPLYPPSLKRRQWPLYPVDTVEDIQVEALLMN